MNVSPLSALLTGRLPASAFREIHGIGVEQVDDEQQQAGPADGVQHPISRLVRRVMTGRCRSTV
jgi:hypothetical protein